MEQEGQEERGDSEELDESFSVDCIFLTIYRHHLPTLAGIPASRVSLCVPRPCPDKSF